MNIPTYERGDVILVDIAYSGSPGGKKRPAVVFSSAEFNQAGTKLVVIALTSNLLPPLRPGDTLLMDWGQAGLLKPSAARGTFATIDKADIYRLLGHVSREDMANIEASIIRILELTLPE